MRAGSCATVLIVALMHWGCSRDSALIQPGTSIVNMPATREAAAPQLLSEVGVFSDLATLTPIPELMPYDINVSFWSDGAEKRRWIGVPAGERIKFSADGEWRFPAGTVFVKNFELPADEVPPGRRAVIETRVLVCGADGGVSGASYRWRADGSDAELVNEPVTAPVGGSESGRTWYFPGREDCRVCHTPAAGGVLGVKTRQMNRPLGAAGENQLLTWDRQGLFEHGLGAIKPERLAKLSAARDSSASVEVRARSYLDVNCANCHRPAGVAGNFDARYSTPLARQNLVDGPVLIDLGIDRARVIAPHDVWRSIALARVETPDLTRMPPLAHERIDREGAGLLRAWIEGMPGAAVLAPPIIETKGGEYHKAVRVVLRHPDAGAVIRYTLDGSAPGKSSPVYEGPVKLTEPATLRARAYKEGATRSIIVQETFIVND
jgi:uncharacterized repeat protein (TIGR03806 family)